VGVWVCGVELVMVSGRRVVLRDEDASSVSVGKNARRLNTLAHYRVVDGSTLAVRTRYTAAAKPANGECRTQRPKHTLAASTTFALEKSQDRQTDRRTETRVPIYKISDDLSMIIFIDELSLIIIYLQCFDAVGWAAGRASAL